jgi:signal peptidase I
MAYQKSLLRESIELFIIAALVFLSVKTFFIQPFRIPSASMMNTLQVGDLILVNRFAYWLDPPQRGDIVVFHYPNDPKVFYVKRVVAMGGETIDIKDNKVIVGNNILTEPYIRDTTRDKGLFTYPLEIPVGAVFVMGDNRNNSQDSRYWGPLQANEIEGKAFLIFWHYRNRQGQMVFYPWWYIFRFQQI